ncbi:hypothetical protein TI03_04180, partial [Achromatium sp. WMS1]
MHIIYLILLCLPFVIQPVLAQDQAVTKPTAEVTHHLPPAAIAETVLAAKNAILVIVSAPVNAPNTNVSERLAA